MDQSLGRHRYDSISRFPMTLLISHRSRMLLITDTRMHRARLTTGVVTQLQAQPMAPNMAKSRARRTDPKNHPTAHMAVLLAVHPRDTEVTRKAHMEVRKVVRVELPRTARAAARPMRSSHSLRPRLRPITRKSHTCLLPFLANQACQYLDCLLLRHRIIYH
jgi:hypothetical protein